MKVYNEVVDVEADGNKPMEIRWRSQSYQVIELIDCWVFEGRWWSRPERRVYMRLLTNGGMLEVYRMGSQWILSRVFD